MRADSSRKMRFAFVAIIFLGCEGCSSIGSRGESEYASTYPSDWLPTLSSGDCSTLSGNYRASTTNTAPITSVSALLRHPAKMHYFLLFAASEIQFKPERVLLEVTNRNVAMQFSTGAGYWLRFDPL